MSFGLIGQAIALFAVTNIDDIVVLAVFFGQAASRSGGLRLDVGQYIGFAGILAASVVGALGAGLLPEAAIPLPRPTAADPSVSSTSSMHCGQSEAPSR